MRGQRTQRLIDVRSSRIDLQCGLNTGILDDLRWPGLYPILDIRNYGHHLEEYTVGPEFRLIRRPVPFPILVVEGDEGKESLVQLLAVLVPVVRSGHLLLREGHLMQREDMEARNALKAIDLYTDVRSFGALLNGEVIAHGAGAVPQELVRLREGVFRENIVEEVVARLRECSRRSEVGGKLLF